MAEEKPEGATTREITEPQEVPRSQVDFFIGKDGLRSGWRLLIYLLIVVGSSVAISFVMGKLLHLQRGVPGVWAQLGQEVIGFAVAFGGAILMSRIERRPLGLYGLPGSEMFGSKFWLGFLFGLLEVTLLVGLISAFGGYSFGTLALPGNKILLWGLFHMVMFTFVGLFEEFLFRGYTQFTLGDGIGFWPAAVVLSLIFGGAHLGNPGEGGVGALSVVMIALLFCFTLKRTGNLWYAVGLHASFDWGETFLYSVPNSGTFMEGHLSNAVLQAGPKWLTGGTVGPEGSVFCFLTMALQFLVVLWLFPAKKGEPVLETPAFQN
jgi:membrane protease YdiL (CAAX protease family)